MSSPPPPAPSSSPSPPPPIGPADSVDSIDMPMRTSPARLPPPAGERLLLRPGSAPEATACRSTTTTLSTACSATGTDDFGGTMPRQVVAEELGDAATCTAAAASSCSAPTIHVPDSNTNNASMEGADTTGTNMEGADRSNGSNDAGDPRGGGISGMGAAAIEHRRRSATAAGASCVTGSINGGRNINNGRNRGSSFNSGSNINSSAPPDGSTITADEMHTIVANLQQDDYDEGEVQDEDDEDEDMAEPGVIVMKKSPCCKGRQSVPNTFSSSSSSSCAASSPTSCVAMESGVAAAPPATAASDIAIDIAIDGNMDNIDIDDSMDHTGSGTDGGATTTTDILATGRTAPNATTTTSAGAGTAAMHVSTPDPTPDAKPDAEATNATTAPATATTTTTTTMLSNIPSAVLSILLHHLGPQSTILGIGSTNRYFRRTCRDDGTWKHFFELRCRSSLDLGSTGGGSVGGAALLANVNANANVDAAELLAAADQMMAAVEAAADAVEATLAANEAATAAVEAAIAANNHNNEAAAAIVNHETTLAAVGGAVGAIEAAAGGHEQEDQGGDMEDQEQQLQQAQQQLAVAVAQSTATQQQRLPQSSSRLSPWKAATTSFENGRESPDETYFVLYRRLHVSGKTQVCVPRGIITCNRSRGGGLGLGLGLGLGGNGLGLGADEDPTMLEAIAIGGGALDAGPNGVGGLGGPGEGMLQVCGAPAVEWCDNPACRRARCDRCTGGSGGGGGGNTRLHAALSHPSTSPAAIGRAIIKCGWCHVRLCRVCARGNLTYCDGCSRGACLDCVTTLADRPLGVIRQCVGKGGNCGAGVCWRCARTVGRSKIKEDGKVDSRVGGRCSPARSPSNAGCTANNSVGDVRACSPSKDLSGGGGGGKFEALNFLSEKQYHDASPRQTLCLRCAEEKVGKLNVYRRIDMSPRVFS